MSVSTRCDTHRGDECVNIVADGIPNAERAASAEGAGRKMSTCPQCSAVCLVTISERALRAC